MIGLNEMRRPLTPETVFVCEDKHGISYEVVDRFKRSPTLEIFYSNGALCIRQENPTGVDLIELTLGQAVDLLRAVSEALEIPVQVT